MSWNFSYVVCPAKVNLYALVGGLAGAIVAVGILLLLAWKVAFVLYDRRQHAKFQAEIKTAKWNETVSRRL